MHIVMSIVVSLWGIHVPVQSSNILHSTGNAKANYNWMITGPSGGYIQSIMTDPADSNKAIAIGYQGWITTDGINWNHLSLKWTVLSSQGVFTGNSRCLIGVRDTLYYSSDGGISFAPIKTTGKVEAISEINSDTVLMVQDSNYNSYLYRTEDGGLNWQIVTPLASSGSISYPIVTYAISNDSVMYLAKSVSSYPDSIYILKSNDRGLSWNIVYADSEPDYHIRDIKVSPYNQDEVFISNGIDSDALLYTPDGFGTMYSYPGVFANDVEFQSQDTILIASQVFGIFKGVRAGASWNFSVIDSLTPCNDLKRSGNIWYAAATTGILKSQDNGNTWLPDESGLHATFNWNAGQITKTIGRTLYFTDAFNMGNAIYKTNDGGVTWQKIYIPKVAVIFGLGIYPQDINTVYVCAAQVELSPPDIYTHNILKSIDGGLTFNAQDSLANPDSYSWRQYIYVSDTNPDIILTAAYDDSLSKWLILRSIDGGYSNTLVNIAEDIYEAFVGKGDTVFFNADSVIYESMNMGQTCDTIFTIPRKTVDAMDYDWTNHILYFSYYDNGSRIFNALYTDSGTVVSDTFQDIGFSGINCGPDGAVYTSEYGYQYQGFSNGLDTCYFMNTDTLDFAIGQIRSSANEVLAFTYGNGVARSTDAVVDVQENAQHSKAGLHFRWDMKSNRLYLSSVREGDIISLYNIEGRVILKKIIKDPKSPIAFTGLKRGVYFAKVASGKTNNICKIVIVK